MTRLRVQRLLRDAQHVALAALAVVLVAAPAHAGSFMATPVKLTLPAGVNSTSLALENTGAEPVLVQSEVMAWSQNEGKDVLTPSQDLVVSPPIFRVAPGATQTVRIGLLKRPPTQREVTYRLFLQEVPQPPKPGEQGVSIALRLGLPVFVLPPGGAKPQLAWSARPEGAGIRLMATNRGNGHVQALEGRLFSEDGTLVADEVLSAYVLPGQTRAWTLKASTPWRGGKLRLVAQTSVGQTIVDLAPQ